MARKGDERRKHPRVEARLAMQLAENALLGTNLVTAESLNVSRGGVYCESPEFLAPLSKVALTVILPAFGAHRERSAMLRCEGVVVRCEPLPPVRSRRRYQLACCFTGLEPEQRDILDEFVSWRALRGRRAAAATPSRTTTATRSAQSAKSGQSAKTAQSTKATKAKKAKGAKPAKSAKAARRVPAARSAKTAPSSRSGTRTPRGSAPRSRS